MALEPKILILGSKGMAGHMISKYFKENSSWEIFELDRSDFDVLEESWKDQIRRMVSDRKITHIINCIGLLKEANNKPVLGIKINSLFPHELVEVLKFFDTKIIHLSTDCWNDQDIYGRSKRAGELDYPNHLTLRTSIIGPELKRNGDGLFHWFMNQQEEIFGFVNHYWDGLTTLELAKAIKEILETKTELSGILDLRCAEKITKFDLLNKIKKIFHKNILISKKETGIVDKTSPNPDIKCRTSYEEQLINLKEWVDKHSFLYEQYLK